MRNFLNGISEYIINKEYRHDLKRMEGERMTYRLMKRLIERDIKNNTIQVTKKDHMKKLDVFLMANRITDEEYMELMALMGGGEHE